MIHESDDDTSYRKDVNLRKIDHHMHDYMEGFSDVVSDNELTIDETLKNEDYRKELSQLPLGTILDLVKGNDIRFPPTASKTDLIQLLLEQKEDEVDTAMKVYETYSEFNDSVASTYNERTNRLDHSEELDGVIPMRVKKKTRRAQSSRQSRSSMNEMRPGFIEGDNRKRSSVKGQKPKYKKKSRAGNPNRVESKRRYKYRGKHRDKRWLDDEDDMIVLLDNLLLPISRKTLDSVSDIASQAQTIVGDIATSLTNIDYDRDFVIEDDELIDLASSDPHHDQSQGSRVERNRREEQPECQKVTESDKDNRRSSSSSSSGTRETREKKAYGVWTDDEENIHKELEEMYGTVTAEAIENIGDTIADVIEGKYWNEAQDLLYGRVDESSQSHQRTTNETQTNGTYNQTQEKRYWKDRISDQVDSALGLNDGRNTSINTEQLSEAVSMFANGQTEEKVSSLIFGKSRQKYRLKNLFRRANGDSIVTTLLTSTFKTSINMMRYLCNWATCRGALPRPIVVFVTAASVFGAPKRRRLMTVGVTLLLLRTVAEALHGYRKRHKDWHEERHDESNNEENS